MLLEKIDAYFAPFREKRKQLAADSGYVEDVLRDGAKRARAEAVEDDGASPRGDWIVSPMRERGERPLARASG